ncbi:hypothetical protein E2C01_032728 [Portunus trituberculatus]|uniref:Uncharacterized protein n=1 Tax=Portunus trituberculatus TaxID=210409 RepID=A0A5B7EWP0_PORTR|nr:hypothetical protein [Portunus trituberculatus]
MGPRSWTGGISLKATIVVRSTERVKKSGETISSLQAKRTTQTRDSAMDKMENGNWKCGLTTRSSTAAHEIEKALGCHREILAAKRRKTTQPSIVSYFRPSTPSTKSSVSPASSLSRDIAQSISSRSHTPSPVTSTSFPCDQDSPDIMGISYSSDSD